MKNNYLNISETFYSIQAENHKTSGVPAVFLRMQGCDLLCGNPNMKNLSKDWKQEDLKKDNNASWLCDSIAVWMRGKKWTIEELIEYWKKDLWLNRLQEGCAHLVITGGEPLLDETQKSLIPLFEKLSISPHKIYIEVETNGTKIPLPEFDKYISQYNCSPKLSNSGIPKERRINIDALQWFSENERTIFKFVINKRDDMEEVEEIVNTFWFSDICLMPGASTREELIKNSQLVAELCKEYGYNFSSRLQLQIWDKVVGV